MIRLLRNRKVVLTMAAMALGASVVAGREKPSLSPAEPVARVQARIEAPQDLDLEKLARPQSDVQRDVQRDAQAAAQADPFARRSFAPPERPAQAAQARPSKPTAPPLPFQYLGKLIENGKLEVILMRGDEVQTIAGGEQLGSDYRVDSVTETAVSFTYLPLKTKQTLDLPSAVN